MPLSAGERTTAAPTSASIYNKSNIMIKRLGHFGPRLERAGDKTVSHSVSFCLISAIGFPPTSFWYSAIASAPMRGQRKRASA